MPELSSVRDMVLCPASCSPLAASILQAFSRGANYCMGFSVLVVSISGGNGEWEEIRIMIQDITNSRMTLQQIIEAIDEGAAVFFTVKEDLYVARCMPINSIAFRRLLEHDPDKEDAEIRAYVDFEGDVIITGGLE